VAAALAALARAIELAQPEGFVRVFLDEGEPMTALLQQAVKGRGASAYPQRLLELATAPVSRSPAGRGGLVEPLSERELEVLRLLPGELDGPGMASHLFVSVNTVRTHTKNIYAKLGVNNRRAAVRRGRELGLLPGDGSPSA
jgi:LuxR family maltose regulon positive regulatory protein